MLPLRNNENLQLIAVAILFALILLPPYLIHGGYLLWLMDGGNYAYYGQQWLRGGLAYVDFWEPRPPFIFLMNAIGLFLGNGHPFGIAAWITICAALFAGLFLWCTRPFCWTARLAACGSVCLWLAKLEALNSIGFYCLVPNLIVLWGYVRDCEDNAWGRNAFWVGMAGGVLAMARPNQALSAGCYALLILWLSRDRLGDSLRFTAGISITAGAGLALVWLRGSIPGLVQAMSFGSEYYVGATSVTSKLLFPVFALENLGESGLLLLGIGVVGFCLFHAIKSYKQVPPIVLAATGVFLMEIAQASVSGRFFSHYLTPALPSCGLLTAWALDAFAKKFDTASLMKWVAATTFAVALAQSAHTTWHTSKIPVPELALADKIKANLGPTDKAFVWVWNKNALPFHLGRSSGVTHHPVLVTISQKAYLYLMPQIVSQLKVARPEVIVDCGPPGLHFLFEHSMRELTSPDGEAPLKTSAIRDQLEDLARGYRVDFSDSATQCVVYRRENQ